MIFTKPRGQKDVPSLAFIVKNILVTLVTYRHLDGSHIQTTLQAVSYSEAWTPEKISEDLKNEGWIEQVTVGPWERRANIPDIIHSFREHLEGLTQLDLRFVETAFEVFYTQGISSPEQRMASLDALEYVSQEVYPEYLPYIEIAKVILGEIENYAKD